MEPGSALKLSQILAFDQADNQRKGQKLEEAIVQLYASMRSSLLAYAYQLTSSTGESEDLVQVAFLKLFDQWKNDAEIQNPRSWLYRVVHNLAIDHIRRKGIYDGAVTEWLAHRSMNDKAPSTEDHLIAHQRISISLQALNERERHCLMLRAEGLSYQEIGAVLGISHKAVGVYLARGLKKFEARNEKRT
ncbi:MAG: RNA polymerase sigma factor [Acidobacteriales bacterium]|nr:RNA polymerase sigma factor [Terriglobales bacterium]